MPDRLDPRGRARRSRSHARHRAAPRGPRGAGARPGVGRACGRPCPARRGGPGHTAAEAGPRRAATLGWAVAAAVVLVLALIPPVRAAVVELLRIGGIVVREEPPPSSPPVTTPATGAVPSAGATAATLEQAEQLIGADIELPTALGPPTSVVVTHEGRVAEVTWDGPSGRARLDVFVGSLSWGFLKTVWQDVTPTQVSGHEAVWLGQPHLIEWVDRAGGTHSEAPRLAGATLAWVVHSAGGEVTYRLEGPTSLPEALRVAGSSR